MVELDKETKDMVSFITFIIPEFAEAYKMNKPEGFRYLEKYGGLDYINENWWALHTDNPKYALRSIFKICKRNGGYL